jgi:hypothetical protein
VLEHLLPDLGHSVAGEPAAGEHRRHPSLAAAVDEAERSGELLGRSSRLDLPVVGLVDRDDVGDLQDPLLDPLELVARPGERQ